MKRPFSKKLLTIDYIVAIVLIVGYIICNLINGIVALDTMNRLITYGVDISNIILPSLFNIDGFGVLLGVWIAQTGLSSTAYYIMLRSEHRLQIATQFVSDLPQEIKDVVDMTNVLTTALSTSDN